MYPNNNQFQCGLDFQLTWPECESLHEWLSTAQSAINRVHHRVVPITNPVVRRIWAELDAKFGNTTEATT
jgi:hypothetical protein